MNKGIARGTLPKSVVFTGSLVLFCAFSFPFVVNAATAVPQPGESIRDTRPRQQVSLENVDTDNKQASRSVRHAQYRTGPYLLFHIPELQ